MWLRAKAASRDLLDLTGLNYYDERIDLTPVENNETISDRIKMIRPKTEDTGTGKEHVQYMRNVLP